MRTEINVWSRCRSPPFFFLALSWPFELNRRPPPAVGRLFSVFFGGVKNASRGAFYFISPAFSLNTHLYAHPFSLISTQNLTKNSQRSTKSNQPVQQADEISINNAPLPPPLRFNSPSTASPLSTVIHHVPFVSRSWKYGSVHHPTAVVRTQKKTEDTNAENTKYQRTSQKHKHRKRCPLVYPSLIRTWETIDETYNYDVDFCRAHTPRL